jgi:CMP/dCMP kinase
VTLQSLTLLARLENRMIVTIDGPAGSGKSTAARRLAQRLGFRFLDTGAMYRSVALAGKLAGVDWQKPAELARLAESIRIDLREDRVFLDGRDVTAEIRTQEITRLTRHAADNTQVRGLLVEQQRRLAAGGDVVAEGRDQATVVFPQAECKIFLTATEEERAERRRRDLQARGEEVTLESVLAAQGERDRQDQQREIGCLRIAADSIVVETDGMTLEEVVDHLEQLVRERISADQS